MTPYTIREIFGPTIQGEGVHAGTPCVFVRFAGCNVWSGRLDDGSRERSACPYCDTDFFGGEKLHLAEIVASIHERANRDVTMVVLSGGEPLLQVDAALIDALTDEGWSVSIETNGLVAPKFGPDEDVWITLSPKGRPREIKIPLEMVDEIKLLVPGGPGGSPEEWDRALTGQAMTHLFLQPIAKDIPPGGTYQWAVAETIGPTLAMAIASGWRVSLQGHKAVGLP